MNRFRVSCLISVFLLISPAVLADSTNAKTDLETRSSGPDSQAGQLPAPRLSPRTSIPRSGSPTAAAQLAPAMRRATFELPRLQIPEVTYSGESRLRQRLSSSATRPTALAADHFDDVFALDLVVGYTGPDGHLLTLHRGNRDANYPDAPPFRSPARIFELPAAPDFLATGDFDADGHRDVVTATRGDHALYLLSGNGRGELSAARTIALDGAVTALLAADVNRRDGLADLVVGVAGPDGFSVRVYEGPGHGALFVEPEVLPMSAEVSALAVGQLDEAGFADLAVAAGNKLRIVHGRDRKMSLGPALRESLEPAVVSDAAVLAEPIVSLSVGHYLWDEHKHQQLALLTTSGAVHVLGRDVESTTPAWKTRITKPVAARATSASSLRTAHVSGAPLDELVVIDGSGRSLQLLLGEIPSAGAAPDALSEPLATTLERPPIAVLPMRLNGDGVDDLVVLQRGSTEPGIIPSAPAAVIVVTSPLHPPAANGACELAEAISNANANGLAFPDCAAGTGPGDVISFTIGGGGFPVVIPLAFPGLPGLTDPFDVIDGTTQCPGSPCVELFGGFVIGDGLAVFGSTGNVIRGMALNGFTTHGILVAGAKDVRIERNHVGTDVTGTVPVANSSLGIEFLDSTTCHADFNLVSANAGDGIAVTESLPAASFGMTFSGNFIGTDVGGVPAAGFGNGLRGIACFGTDSNEIGQPVAGALNLISNNLSDGVGLVPGLDGADFNRVQNNLIGTDGTGFAPAGNAFRGVWIESSTMNLVGGTTPAERNVISANVFDGVALFLATDNTVQGNYLGTDVLGGAPLGNIGLGVAGFDAAGSTIGGGVPGAGNVTAANQFGIGVGSFAAPGLANTNIIQGNLVGLDATGTVPLGNGFSGIILQDTSFNLVGGTSPAERNVSSANAAHGAHLLTINFPPPSTFANTLTGNYFGTDIGGTVGLGNGLQGVQVEDSEENTIGGANPGDGNLISGNFQYGVEFLESGFVGGTHSNLATKNVIGLDSLGVPLPNLLGGVLIQDASFNSIGENLIHANGGPGVTVWEFLPHPTLANTILSNTIFMNGALGIDLNNDGPSFDDPLDPDGLANLTQNYGFVTQADVGLGSTVISGQVNTNAGINLTMQAFHSPSCDPSTFGEGRTFLGSANVLSNALGDASYSFVSPGTLPLGTFVTQTATSPDGTSEFSKCFPVSACVLIGFPYNVLALDKNTMSWGIADDVKSVKGPLSGVSTYTTIGAPLFLNGASFRDISGDNPTSGQAFWYLQRLQGCGSWQCPPIGSHPARDLVLQ